MVLLSQLIFCQTGEIYESVLTIAPPIVSDVELCGSGTATLTASGASEEETYNWYDSEEGSVPIATGSVFEPQEIVSDTVFWVAIDSSGIESERVAVIITVIYLPAIDLGNDTVLCEGTNISLDAGADYDSYSWSTGATSQTINVITAGTYSVEVSKSTCTATDAVYVGFDEAISVNLGNDTSLCVGTNISLDAGADYDSYSWSTGATSQTINVITTGTYSVEVSKGACSANDAVYVGFDEAITVNLGNDTILCEGTNISLDAGTSYDSYLWSTGATSQTINVITTGTYSVEVSKGACSATDAVVISFDEAITVNLGNDTTLCEGTNISLDAGADYDSYSWSTGATSQTINVITAGTYSIEVSKGACTATDAVYVGFDEAITVNLGNDTTLCEGTSIRLDAGTGYDSYLWSTGATSQTINVITAGTYSVEVNKGACTAINAIDVGIDEAITVDLGNDPEECEGTSIRLDAGAGYDNYLWSTGATSQIINVITAGTYSVEVRKGACSAIDAVDVGFDEAITVDLGNDITQCGGSVGIDAGANYDDYLWNTGALTQSISVNTTGVYSIEVRKGACTATDEVRVNFDTPITIDLGADIFACFGGTVVLNAGSGYDTYLWSTGSASQVISVTSAGTFSVVVTKGTCSSSNSINVMFGDALNIDLGSDIFACEGDSVILDAGMGYDSYLWNTGESNRSIVVTDSGEYSVEVTSGECYAMDKTAVSFDESITVNLGDDLEICEVESVILDGGIGYDSYLWSTSETSQEIEVNTGGEYSIEVRKGACTAADNVFITFGEKIPLDLGEDMNECDIDTIILDAGPGFDSYLWSTGEISQSIIVTESDNYYVTVQYCGVTKSDDIEVSLNPLPEVFLGKDTILGAIQELYLDAGDGFYSYVWNTGEDKRIILVSGLSEGEYEYSVVVTDENGCANSDTIQVIVLYQNQLSNVNDKRSIQVYPNPTKELIYIQPEYDIAGELVISIFDNTGKCLLREKLFWLLKDQVYKIDMNNFKSGLYLLQLNTNNSMKIEKIIKE